MARSSLPRRRSARDVARVGGWLLLIAVVAGGCSAGGPSPSPRPSATAEAVPPTADELEAIRFRTENSLRADLEHVRAVAIDRTATTEFGVPLLPSELDELMSRAANVEAIIPIVEAEGAKAPDDYCGLYIDNANGGALTSGWKANLVLHELSIRAQLRPGARVAFIGCRFSEVEVNRTCELLRATDHDWMKAIPAQLEGYGCGSKDFRVNMEISSAVPTAAEQVRLHYEGLLQLPPGILAVASDGTGVRLVPWGGVRVYVTRPDGRPVGESNLSLLWASEVEGLDCGIMDMGFGVRSDGKPTELPCQAGTWTIKVIETIDDVYGQGRVVVRANETTDLRITLTREPPPFE